MQKSKLKNSESRKSESDFEDYCGRRKIEFVSLDEKNASQENRDLFLKDPRGKSPDYFCKKNDLKFFVEIKTLTTYINGKVEGQMNERCPVISGDYDIDIAKPIKGAVKSAVRQFKNIKNNFPTVLLLCGSESDGHFKQDDINGDIIKSIFLDSEKKGLGLFNISESDYISACIYWNDEEKKYTYIQNLKAKNIFSEEMFGFLFEDEMSEKKFSGAKKEGGWLLERFDKKAVSILLPGVPSFVETYHLTLLTLLWSALFVFAGYMAKENLAWLWLASLAVFLQYVTDILDGAVGRTRKTGLVKWGYYMDHFLDFVFFYAMIVGYAFIFPVSLSYVFLILSGIIGAMMVNFFLDFAATNHFKISFLGIGPTEGRLLVILLNTYIIFWGIEFLEKILPWVACFLTIPLIVMVYKTQREIWNIDMAEKEK